ncbi:uncharacterized protein LOC115367457 isoform X2 [Myripristis murdjan]|uniref:uncharacterized protein LOC115367457 isoform X2 n=1 Tax=Myripristis murdjan TaxID=586833 RepID=UPI001175D863|nr:uncharacterized protein LOC115367457 isoform X2 [Myripristis murdjan]
MRQPLLQPRPSQPDKPESARQTRPAHTDAQTVRRSGKLVMRRVCVSELDQRFADVAETFNDQQQRYEAMVRHIVNLRQTYGCNHDDTLLLSECMKTIREEHDARYKVCLHMKGYDFSLSVAPLGSKDETEEPLPPHLRLAQEEVRAASQSAKVTVSVGTKLQEMIGWLLHCEEQMAEQVREAAPSYQEQGRLDENLKESMKEVRRAKELSLGYKQQAGEVLTEAAQIAGTKL